MAQVRGVSTSRRWTMMTRPSGMATSICLVYHNGLDGSTSSTAALARGAGESGSWRKLHDEGSTTSSRLEYALVCRSQRNYTRRLLVSLATAMGARMAGRPPFAEGRQWHKRASKASRYVNRRV